MSTDSFLRWSRKAHRLANRSQQSLLVLQEELQELLAEEGLEDSLTLDLPADDELPEAPDEATRQLMEELRALQESLGSVDMPDFDNLQRFVGWLLAHYTWRTGILDDRHHQRRQQRWVLRDRREQAAEAAYEILVRVRGTLTSNLRPEAAESILGLSGRTPRFPGTLRRVLEMAIRRMRNPKPYFDDTHVRGHVQNWDDLIAQLEEVRDELDEAETAWARDHSLERHELEAKKKAMVRYRQIHAASRHFIKGLMYLAGRPEWVKDVSDKLPVRGPAEATEGEPDSLPEEPKPADGEADSMAAE